ncbi:formyltransferase family protein [Desulfoplanes formicivorans]|uniref:Methionyl-tRNA formyltransferase n=1 Tax=Desulfoplanes formicivorans TaxID=1592317 RepID=A0A194AJG9_9BACT|nr:formyltransferase family protein [Desulfoplanes formicivorans]GAU09385.1 methionyl-tRNA formyltransferase [Desulfoplanes formicivorans]
MTLEDTIIITADTARSKAYTQAMIENGIKIKGGIFFEASGPKTGQTKKIPEREWPGSPVYLPDLSLNLEQSLHEACKTVKTVTATHINDAPISEAITELKPELIIYSGYGSQIVGEHLINGSAPFLHIHSGWLPDFRGSTTTYFHLLATRNCGVSAILLEKEIDTGPILARKSYPKPPKNIDIDYLYDCAIRADLLCQVLLHYGNHHVLPQVIPQQPDKGNTYYVIHPVLKHIAILTLD